MSKRKATIIVVCPISGARLCQDNKYRTFANFGTYPSCVKEFKSQGWAQRAAKRFRTQTLIAHHRELQEKREKLFPETHLVYLYEGDTMDACGEVVRGCCDKRAI